MTNSRDDIETFNNAIIQDKEEYNDPFKSNLEDDLIIINLSSLECVKRLVKYNYLSVSILHWALGNETNTHN